MRTDRRISFSEETKPCVATPWKTYRAAAGAAALGAPGGFRRALVLSGVPGAGRNAAGPEFQPPWHPGARPCPGPYPRIPTIYFVCHPDGAAVGSDWRDLQPGTAVTLDGRALPWSRLHEGIPVLWETTFFFQRAKPIVVSPFENPFPTRGRGPWTPWGAADRRWFLPIPSTGRDAPTASCSVLRLFCHRMVS